MRLSLPILSVVLIAASSGASAAPVNPAPPSVDRANGNVVNVGWRGHGWHRHGWHGHHRHGWYGRRHGYGWGPVIGGLAAGAIVGSAIASSHAQASANAYCEQKYRSYDPASGTYLGYDGERHPCP
jgi:hypothetical protein